MKNEYLSLPDNAPELTRAPVAEPKQVARAPVAKAKPSNSGDYIINKGDTLSAIAKRNNIDVDELSRINNLVDVHNIKAGSKLKLKESPKEVVDSPVTKALKSSGPLRVSKMDLDKIEADKAGKYDSMTSYDKKGEDPRTKFKRDVEQGLVGGTLTGGSVMTAPVTGVLKAPKAIATAANSATKMVNKVSNALDQRKFSKAVDAKEAATRAASSDPVVPLKDSGYLPTLRKQREVQRSIERGTPIPSKDSIIKDAQVVPIRKGNKAGAGQSRKPLEIDGDNPRVKPQTYVGKKDITLNDVRNVPYGPTGAVRKSK
jgi:LysM repeat protein